MPAAPDASARSVENMKVRAEAERSGEPFLSYSNAAGAQQVTRLHDQTSSLSVGRQPSCDLVLEWDDQVSRLHACLERVEDGWQVVDQSRNGTFVNDQRLTEPHRLRDGDTVRFGTTNIVFHAPSRAPEATAPASATEPPEPARAPISLSSTQRRVLQALCRPYKGRGTFASPASDEQISEDLFLSIPEVRTHLRVLYAKLGVEKLREPEQRVRLVEIALLGGLISEQDL